QEERARERAESARRQSARDAALCDALLALGAAVQAWRDRAVPVLAEAEQSVHAAALELAAAVLTHELADGPTAARSVLTRALAMPAELEPSTMRVHPETLVEIERLLEAGEATLPGGVELAADPRLGRGDVLVEHSDGALDARIGAGLDRARAILEGGL
ncbi:FliH/SctL family protein, partial [Demequina mangrovi]